MQHHRLAKHCVCVCVCVQGLLYLFLLPVAAVALTLTILLLNVDPTGPQLVLSLHNMEQFTPG